MIALRNKTVVHSILSSFDSAKDYLRQEIVEIIEIQKFCFHSNVMSHFSSCPSYFILAYRYVDMC